MERTFQAARRLQGYARSWLDQSLDPKTRGSAEDDDHLLMIDPRRLIINVTVASDTTAAQAKLRLTWGGALCVSPARYTEVELLHVLHEVATTPGMLTASRRHDRVDLQVIYDDGWLQSQLDERFGDGLVVVTSALKPIDV